MSEVEGNSEDHIVAVTEVFLWPISHQLQLGSGGRKARNSTWMSSFSKNSVSHWKPSSRGLHTEAFPPLGLAHQLWFLVGHDKTQKRQAGEEREETADATWRRTRLVYDHTWDTFQGLPEMLEENITVRGRQNRQMLLLCAEHRRGLGTRDIWLSGTRKVLAAYHLQTSTGFFSLIPVPWGLCMSWGQAQCLPGGQGSIKTWGMGKGMNRAGSRKLLSRTLRERYFWCLVSIHATRR